MAEEKETFDVSTHSLVPKHEIMEEKDVEIILAKYGAERRQLPKISKNDPAIKGLKASKSQVIRITRKSETAGKTIYYRVVI
jgi:DNA-directed RNA polymerase subunit H